MFLTLLPLSGVLRSDLRLVPAGVLKLTAACTYRRAGPVGLSVVEISVVPIVLGPRLLTLVTIL